MASKKAGKSGGSKTVQTLTHEEAKRKNIPTAEYQSVMQKEAQDPLRVAYERRNKDLDPQLVWRGKDTQDWSDLVVHAPPLYIQEKVHPKALIDDLLRESREKDHEAGQATADLFADFNGMPKGVDRTEFYQHDQNWANRMILGDSLQVMASLAEREGLRGKVQCIYFDPPYGIKFNSNFQWSTTDRDVKDGNPAHITREPEQVKAFRDTWRDGIHSYLSYLRDRLTAARDLLSESGSIFVQIGDENVHRVRSVMDEIFGDENSIAEIVLKTTSGAGSPTGGTVTLAGVHDYILWFAKRKEAVKYRQLHFEKSDMQSADLYRRIVLLTGEDRNATSEELDGSVKLPEGASLFRPDNLTSQSSPESATFKVSYRDMKIGPGKGGWKTNPIGMGRLISAGRLYLTRNGSLQYLRKWEDFNAAPINDVWTDVGTGSFTTEKTYVVQTNSKIIARCLMMVTDPGDLVLDPTCGSGTTAFVAEQWGRRWITIDTSRVALALARARIMGSRYPFYLLSDSRDGHAKEAEITRTAPSVQPVHDNIRHGFVYERVPHITLKSIVNNAEIDVIWGKWQAILEPLRERFNAVLKNDWQEWDIPRDAGEKWSDPVKKLHTDWWEARIGRQKEIDASIAAKAEYEYLYDKPYSDNRKVRVAGPFTVESLSPHRVLGVDENDELIDPNRVHGVGSELEPKQDFHQMILENLKTAGVQQARKDDKILFKSLTPWPGDLVCGEGRYSEGSSGTGPERRAAIFIGPEFGTVTRPDLVSAAKEAGDSDFDVLIACAFNYEAHATEFSKLGRIPVLKARMNADLHMSEDLKNTGKGNLFVIFGEPDITLLTEADGRIRVKVNGVDVFDPSSGEVRSDGADGIACWFIDTDYNEESFFVRHAYFLGTNDPYGALKTTLKAEINEEAWATLHSDTSRPFKKPKNGRIAVKVINHLGDEVMKVFRV
jgi:adenine-specific DNA-methyltransferase